MPFIGRGYEYNLLQKLEEKKEGGRLIVIYGRRRVGKTRLIEEFYKKRNLWKFDGLERQPKSKQIRLFLSTLAKYAKDPLYETAMCKDWLEVFKLLDQAIQKFFSKRPLTLFFDELPYLANGRSEMISDLKWAWDNLWSKKNGLTLVLCGSVASFMVDSVIRSSALYGRIQLEICLKPLRLQDCFDFFDGKRSYRELVHLYMFCGGIPAYWNQFAAHVSVAEEINRLAFCQDGFFTKEFERIFKDIFHEEKIYKKIIVLFVRHKSLKVTELLALLDMSGGSGFHRYLDHLEKAGFIKGYTPLDSPDSSKLKRYCLEDEYLHFYFKFIQPRLKKIENNTDKNLFADCMRSRSYQSWAGLAFERLCLKHVDQIMKALQIDQLVKDYGPYYNRASNTKEGYQIDLLFYRHDPVITVCEMKYHSNRIGTWIVDTIEKKLSLLPDVKESLEKVLITTEGITKDLEETNYFSKVLLVERLFAQT